MLIGSFFRSSGNRTVEKTEENLKEQAKEKADKQGATGIVKRWHLIHFNSFVVLDSLTRRGCGMRVTLKVAGCVRSYYFVVFDWFTRRVCCRCLPLAVLFFVRFNSFVAFDGLTRRSCGRCFALNVFVFRLNSIVAFG